MFFGVLLFRSFFVIIHNAGVCARAAHAAADTDSRFNRVNTLEKTEQKSGGRGPAGIVKRIFGSFRDGSAEEFFSDMRWIFGYTKKYKWFVVIQILFGVLSASLSLVSAIISKYAIDIVIKQKNRLTLAAYRCCCGKCGCGACVFKPSVACFRKNCSSGEQRYAGGTFRQTYAGGLAGR